MIGSAVIATNSVPLPVTMVVADCAHNRQVVLDSLSKVLAALLARCTCCGPPTHFEAYLGVGRGTWKTLD